jgi:cell filamentation protein
VPVAASPARTPGSGRVGYCWSACDALVGRLAHYLGEVNALHPFREGNGRAQHAFFGQLARDAGFTLAWQHLDPARNVKASAANMRSDPEPMREMLDALTRGST